MGSNYGNSIDVRINDLFIVEHVTGYKSLKNVFLYKSMFVRSHDRERWVCMCQSVPSFAM